MDSGEMFWILTGRDYSFYDMKRIILKRTPKKVELPSPYPYTIQHPPHLKAFGDNLMCATFCDILNNNGIPSVLNNDLIGDLVECPIFNPFESGPIFRTNKNDNTVNIYLDLASSFERRFNISVKVPDKYVVPTKFIPMDINAVDVAVTTSVAQYSDSVHQYSRYKEWPYFDELFSLFDRHNISYIDLDSNGIRDYLFLNYIRKCKVYLGLDTGSAHYASKEGAGKTLILQGGFCDFEHWAGRYDFEAIQVPIDCGPCWNIYTSCENNNKCMKDISPEMVLESVMRKLEN